MLLSSSGCRSRRVVWPESADFELLGEGSRLHVVAGKVPYMSTSRSERCRQVVQPPRDTTAVGGCRICTAKCWRACRGACSDSM